MFIWMNINLHLDEGNLYMSYFSFYYVNIDILILFHNQDKVFTVFSSRLVHRAEKRDKANVDMPIMMGGGA